MAKYRTVNTRFWSDNFVSELNPLDRYLFLYFLTNDHTNIIGIYEIPLRTVSFETGIEVDMLKKMLIRLDGKIFYVDGWVYIVNFKKYQAYDNPSVKKGMEVALNTIPTKIINKINKLRQSVTGPDSLSEDPSNIDINIDSNIDINIDSNIDSNSFDSPLKVDREKAIIKRMRTIYPEEFERFWTVCPKQSGKPVAYESFKLIDPSLYPEIIEAMKKQAASGIWTEDKFTPVPSTWLNQMRWEDKPLITNIDPIETEARELAKKYPPENDTTAEFRFSAKYGVEKLLKYKHIFKM